MNEQLIVKNFGPIKDATVDFKRVTVFIGPTGGGKSTLAKLAAIFGNHLYFEVATGDTIKVNALADFQLDNFKKINSAVFSESKNVTKAIHPKRETMLMSLKEKPKQTLDDEFVNVRSLLKAANLIIAQADSEQDDLLKRELLSNAVNLIEKANGSSTTRKQIIKAAAFYSEPIYIPSDRAFVAAITSSWPGLMRDDIGLPKTLLRFANAFFQARDETKEVSIPFLKVNYSRHDDKDFIRFALEESAILLYEAASGIQSVTPLLVLLEHLSRNTEQAQSFIIEEPELNLYPTAQQGLLNWLVEKCTQGENDLTITTHSPYILSSCNLLLEAYKVAQLRPDLEEEIAAIVPKACWLNPDEFAAYYVADGTVKPITDERTHLIGGNELDAVSGDISDSFRKLLRLQKQKQQSA
jgi:predicted ATPase